MGKSFKRNDDLMIDSSAIAIDSDGTSLQDGVKYKIYNSVVDLGFTSGSATIAGVFDALPVRSVLICPANNFSTSEVPSIYGAIEMVKPNSRAVAWIFFHGKEVSQGDYRMLINSANNPTGTWVKCGAIASTQTVVVSQTTSVAAGSAATVTKTISRISGTTAVAVLQASGWLTPTAVSINNTTFAVTLTNLSGGSHSGVATFLIIEYY